MSPLSTALPCLTCGVQYRTTWHCPYFPAVVLGPSTRALVESVSHIEDSEVEQLIADVARLANETETEAMRRTLLERKERLQVGQTSGSRQARMMTVLERKIWPAIPPRCGEPCCRKTRKSESSGMARLVCNAGWAFWFS